jgi:hypothetical protein
VRKVRCCYEPLGGRNYRERVTTLQYVPYLSTSGKGIGRSLTLQYLREVGASLAIR